MNMNKFIAIGLGLGISFTATCISNSWFTDTTSKNHTINTGELVKEEYVTNAFIDDDFFSFNMELEIMLPTNLQDISNLNISSISGTGVFSNIRRGNVDDEEHLDIKFWSALDWKEIGNYNFMQFTLKYKKNNNNVEETYLVKFIKTTQRKFDAYWYLINTEQVNTLVDDILDETTIPPEIEETPKETSGENNEVKPEEPSEESNPKEEEVKPEEPSEESNPTGQEVKQIIPQKQPEEIKLEDLSVEIQEIQSTEEINM